MAMIAGMMLSLHTPQTTRTAADGSFELKGLTPGHYDLLVEHSEHCPHRITALALLTGTIQIEDAKLQAGTKIHGQILDKAGMPIAGAEVQISRNNKPQVWTAQTDKDGRYEFATLLPAGAYAIHSARPVADNVFQKLIDMNASRRMLNIDPDQRSMDVTLVIRTP